MKKSTKILLTIPPTIALLIVSLMFEGCSFFVEGTESGREEVSITAISFARQSLTVQNGGNDYLKYSVEPSSVQNTTSVEWSYDQNIIAIDADRYGVVVMGKKSGQTYLKATVNGITATCLVTVGETPTSMRASLTSTQISRSSSLRLEAARPSQPHCTAEARPTWRISHGR